MKPGSKVASPKSMTSALAGIWASLPTASIFFPEITTTPCSTSLPDTESNRRAALSTIGAATGAGSAKLACVKIAAARPSAQVVIRMSRPSL